MGKVPRSNNIKSKIKPKKKPAFDAQAFLDSAGVARKVAEFKKKEAIFSQGDPANDVLYKSPHRSETLSNAVFFCVVAERTVGHLQHFRSADANSFSRLCRQVLNFR
jgi:hypothetical protein